MPKQLNPSRIQAQTVQKPAPEKVPKNSFTSPLEPIKNNKIKNNQPPKNYLTSPSDAHKKDEEGQRQCLTSPDRQLRKHEKPRKNHVVDGAVDGAAGCNGTFGGSSGLRSARCRNSQTPAGFKPKLSKNQPPKKCQKTLSRHLWNP